MKILHITWTLGIGGIERLILDLAKHQLNDGLFPSVLVGQAIGGLKTEFAKAEIPIIDAQLSRGFEPAWRHGRSIIRAMKQFDVLHMHAYNPFIARLAKRSKTPIIYTDHGNNALGRSKTAFEHVTFPMRDRFMEQCTFLSFNSHYTKAEAKKRIDLQKVSNSVVHNGVAANTTPVALQSNEVQDLYFEPEANFVIGTSSRFVGFKRVDRLIRAFSLMQPQPNSHLILVGDGPLREEYEALCASLGLSSKITFTGFKTPIAPYQELMDVCVFPSAGEPFGLVAVETFARGKPTVVMADGGGILEIIETVEPKDIVADVEKLAERLIQYQNKWSRGELHKEQNIKARKSRAQDFSVERMAFEFKTIYQRVRMGTIEC